MGLYSVDNFLKGRSSSTIGEDIRRGLTSSPKSLPPKYFYDERGSALFERISRLPEYYLTRVERSLKSCLAGALLEEACPSEVIELGPGSTDKARLLLDARGGGYHISRYVLFDFSERSVRDAARELADSYPSLEVHGVVGDFEGDLAHLPPPGGRRLVAFLGSTIGNLDPPARRAFLVKVRRLMAPGDQLLLGVDLVKDRAVLEAAYNDAGGITAEFNRNILRVVNRAVQADFQPEAFQHHAFYNPTDSRIEMHLVPTSPQTVNLKGIGLSISVLPGETIWTESSYKFTSESVRGILREAGLRLVRWDTDRESMFALALAGPE